ncbi:MAG: deoxyribose-phosphate aldolase [bacterium]|nr:deoxyribose-phosphate aldolase [bacterium]
METNKVLPFDIAMVNAVCVNVPAILRRTQTLGTRRTFKVESQVAAQIRATSCLDLTTLSGADTPERVKRLCKKALNPVDQSILTQLGIPERSVTVGAVCVYDAMVPIALRALGGRIPVAAVSTGFAAGQTPFYLKLREIETSIQRGATEIDVVITRSFVHQGKWSELYHEIKAFREVCGTRAKMKTILGVGDLEELEKIAKASIVAIMAGSDFIKTSTGFEPTNATPEAGLVMARVIRQFFEWYGIKVGLKPAGGLRFSKDALLWLSLMLEELGEEWTKPELFRLGASGLLIDLDRQLEHGATGRYSRAQNHAMG